MLPMAFSPTSGGALRDTLPSAHLHPSVDGATWRAARELALQYLSRLGNDTRLSTSFAPCLNALRLHLENASEKMGRLG